MIGKPINDEACLGPATQVAAEMVARRDPVLLELAKKWPTLPQLFAGIRAMPQRDDMSDPDDGPRLKQCDPDQRLRIGADLMYPLTGDSDPNCFERALTGMAAAELIAPEHLYQMQTVMTALGLHTVLLVDGVVVNLNPSVSQENVECGAAMSSPGPVAIEPRKAVEWTVDLAKQEVPAVRNGAAPTLQGAAALRRFVDGGHVPSASDTDAIGLMLALAERAAHRYGPRALAIVRTVARAIASLIDTVLERRNASINLGGLKFDTPRWLDDTAGAVGNVGLNLGSAVLRHKLDAWDLAGMLGLPGGTAAVVGLLESELGQRGRTLGTLAHPPELTTFAKFARPRTV